MTPADVGPLELLVIQPTPFCNIDCSYCYLPHRSVTRKMSPALLEQSLDWVFSSGLVRQPFTLLWHAGEPLVMPPAFYDQAGDMLDRFDPERSLVTQSFQTNATLLDDAWCELIRRRNIRVGVSVDGPAFLHDRCRQTRSGAGTLDRVLAGIDKLHEHDIAFQVITVLTAESLNYPDELLDFYREHGITDVAFNVEEIEGPHVSSSLSGTEVRERFREFLGRFFDLALSREPCMRVREFECAFESIRGTRVKSGERMQESKPFAIVNVSCDGEFSSYSPELLGLSSPRHGSFALGNVRSDSLTDILSTRHFLDLDEEIGRGIDLCRRDCDYFDLCGGGTPGNKHFENGSCASTETLFCRLHKQVCIDVTLDKLERWKAMGWKAMA